MSRNRTARLALYEDVKEILDAALAAGGGEYELPDHGKAVHWRQRAYKFRKLYAEVIGGVSPYDRLTLRRLEPTSSTVIINLIETKGIFRPKSPLSKPAPLDDELLSEAERIAKDLGLDYEL